MRKSRIWGFLGICFYISEVVAEIRGVADHPDGPPVELRLCVAVFLLTMWSWTTVLANRSITRLERKAERLRELERETIRQMGER